MEKRFRVPATLIVAIIVAIVGLLQGEWFAGEEWVPLVIIGLNAIAQMVEMMADKSKAVRSLGSRGWSFGRIMGRLAFGAD